jgi:hypothetical protein
MSIDQFEVGMRIEATSDFEVEEMLAAPTGGGAYEIKTGDTGEVVNKQVVGRSAWLRVRWDRLKRELNVDRNALPHVRPLG